MNKSEFDDFIERGREYGADLFLENRIFHIQCDYDCDAKKYNLIIYSFKAQKCGNHSFSAYVDKNNKYVGYEDVVDEYYDTRESAKLRLLSGKFFDGFGFWNIYEKFEWLDDDGPSFLADK